MQIATRRCMGFRGSGFRGSGFIGFRGLGFRDSALGPQPYNLLGLPSANREAFTVGADANPESPILLN